MSRRRYRRPLTDADIEAMRLDVPLVSLFGLNGPPTPPPALVRRQNTGAKRVSAYRQRQRRGEIVLSIVVPEHQVAAFLIATGRLTEDCAIDKRQIEAAIAEVLVELAARWLPPKL